MRSGGKDGWGWGGGKVGGSMQALFMALIEVRLIATYIAGSR